MRVRKKPIESDAVKWFPDPRFGEFKNGKYVNHSIGCDVHGVEYTVCDVGLRTRSGFQHIRPGDVIIVDVEGKPYVCAKSVFYKTYEIVT